MAQWTAAVPVEERLTSTWSATSVSGEILPTNSLTPPTLKTAMVRVDTGSLGGRVCVCGGGGGGEGGNTDQRCPISQAWSCGTEAHLSLFHLFLLVILTRVFHVFNGHPDDHRRLKWNGTENMFIFMCVRARVFVCVCVGGGGG